MKRPCAPTRRRGVDTLKEASMKALRVVLLALLVAWPALAAAQTIKVGAVVPLTGRYGGGGAQVRAGYEIAVEHLNAAGGVAVGGKKMALELALLDDESDATKTRSEEHTSELQSPCNLVCRLLLEKKKQKTHRLLTPYVALS